VLLIGEKTQKNAIALDLPSCDRPLITFNISLEKNEGNGDYRSSKFQVFKNLDEGFQLIPLLRRKRTVL
jgi:hypothetical protein